MPAPTLTSEQRAALIAERAMVADNLAAYTANLASIPTKIAELQNLDDSYAAQITYLNDSIIGPYDDERKAINGDYEGSPVTDSDLTDCAEDLTGILYPTPPIWDINRVDYFDGAALVNDSNNETANIVTQTLLENILTSGASPTPTLNPATAVTASSLTASSTSLNVADPTNLMTFTIGDYFVATGSGTASLVKVTSVSQTDPNPAPVAFTLGIEIIGRPANTITSGAVLTVFTTGFTNTERTNKVTTIPSQQALMDSLIASLEYVLNQRKTNCNSQITAIGDNEDLYAINDLATAAEEATDTIAFIDNYLLTTLISNVGLASLASERGTRGTFLTSRLVQINAAYTDQAVNYYDQRYTFSNLRANLFNGTLRLLKTVAESQTTIETIIDNLTANLASIDFLLS